MKFISRYDLDKTCLTDDVFVTDDMLLRYSKDLLEGFTLQKIKYEAERIKEYLRAVDEHYKRNVCPCHGI